MDDLICPMCGEEVDQNDVDCPYCAEPLQAGGGQYSTGGLYRKGKTLVMQVDAQLPERCIKSNEPAQHRLTRKLSWYPPAVIVLLLCGLIPFVIVALLVSKRATIQIGLSDKWYEKRRRAIIISWGLVLLAVVMLVAGIATIDRGETGTALIVFSLVIFLFGALFGLMSARLVYPNKITNTHIWLVGACPEYLAGLPEWRGG